MGLSNTTPNAVDPFARTMAALFDETKIVGVSTAFQAFFGRAGTASETIYSPDANIVDIDIIRGKKKIAALIPRGSVSRPLGSLQSNIASERFSTFSRKFPLAEEEGDISADQLTFRIAGENPYEKMSRLDRMRYHALRIHTENIRRIIDMNELLASKSILEGIQPAIIGTTDTNLQYDFRRSSGNIITVSVGWNQTSNDLLGDIDTGCDRVKQVGKAIPDIIAVGRNALDALIKDTTVQTLADNRRFELIQVSREFPVPEKFNFMVENGWVAYGRLRTPKGHEVWIFINHEFYEDDTTVYPYMPLDQAFIASSGARMDRHFGPPEMLPMIPQRVQLYQELFGFDLNMAPMPMGAGSSGVITPEMFYADAYVSGNWKRVTVRSQCAPVFATTQTDAIVTLKGLVT